MRSLLQFSVATALCLSCGSPFENPPGGSFDAGIPDLVGPMATTDPVSKCYNAETLPMQPDPPSLDSTPLETSYDAMVLKGSAEGSGDVLVTGGRSTASATVSAGGAFCVEVPLKHGQVNDLLIYGISNDICGVSSDPAAMSVRHVVVPMPERHRKLLFRSSRAGALREAVSGWNHAKPAASGNPEQRKGVLGWIRWTQRQSGSPQSVWGHPRAQLG